MSSIGRGKADLKENIRSDSGTEDELSAPTKLSRVAPRNSLAGRPSPTSLNPTPHANVRDTGRLLNCTTDSWHFVVATVGGTHTKAINNTAEAPFEPRRSTIAAAHRPKHSHTITHTECSSAFTTNLWE